MSPSKDTPSPGGKIAIRGFSLSAKSSASKPGAKPKPPPPSNLGKRPRTHFGHDSESEDEEHKRAGKHEAVTGFGAQGAEKKEESVGRRAGGELVIKKMENRDWRGEARRRQGTGKDLLPKEERAQRDAREKEKEGGNGKIEGVDMVNGNDDAIQWGLTVRKRVRTEEQGDDNTPVESTTADGDTKADEAPQKPKTADEEALESLLGTNKVKKGPDLVISSATTVPLSEQEAYKAAVASAPDPSTLEDYERIPVEEFGAAMLRGMGWKGEKTAKPKDVKRRQNLLGLGAKELDGAEELGAWVQKSDVKRLNPGGGKGGGSFGGGERKPKAGEYKRERDRERERREERGGGSYKRERERERERERDRGYGDSGRDRDRRR